MPRHLFITFLGAFILYCIIFPSPPVRAAVQNQPPRGSTRAFAMQSACDWTSVWQTNWGDMELVQQGSRVIGTYTHDQGKIDGEVLGLSLRGTWSESPSYAPPNDAGDFEFDLAADCQSFTGRWRYGSQGDWADWSGNSSRLAVTPVLAATLIASTVAAPVPASPLSPASGAFVVDAVDNDAENLIWNCDTNRVPFGNEGSDVSRCFTFRYSVPSGGIVSAVLTMSVKPLGGLQDTDAIVVAIDQPNPDCAWGQGKMPGCVVLHGGFRGDEKSVNIDLFNIACDSSINAKPELQRAVIDRVETGVVHMMLEDDTAAYGAQLVLNAGASNLPCGAFTQPFVRQEFTAVPAALPIETTAPASAPGITTAPVLSPIETTANTFLTGMANPPPPAPEAIATAAATGTVVLALYTVLNGLLSNLAVGGAVAPLTQIPGSASPTARDAGMPASARDAESKPVAKSSSATRGAAPQAPSAHDRAAPSPARPLDAARGSPTEGQGILSGLSDEVDGQLRDSLDNVKGIIEGMAEPGESTWNCKSCGRENRDDHKFCVKCGTPRPNEG